MIASALRSIFGKKTLTQATPGLRVGHDQDSGKLILLDNATLRNHMLLSSHHTGVGVPRFTEEILTQQTEAGRGWIYINDHLDRPALERLAATARAHGRHDEFLVIDLAERVYSNSYDLLRNGSPEERAARVMQVLPDNDALFQSETKIAQLRTLLSSVFAAVDATGKSVGIHALGMLLSKLPDESAQRELLVQVPATHEAHQALSRVLAEYRNKTELKTLLGSLPGRLLALGSTHFAELVDQVLPEVEFPDVLANNKMCVVMLPSLAFDRNHVQILGGMILHDISCAIMARASVPVRSRKPFVAVFDNIQTYGFQRANQAPLPAEAFSRARGLNVSLVPVLTGVSWAHLESVAPKDFELYTGNIVTTVYFKQPHDPVALERHRSLPTNALELLQANEFWIADGLTSFRGKLSYQTVDARPAAFVPHHAPPTGPMRERLSMRVGWETLAT